MGQHSKATYNHRLHSRTPAGDDNFTDLAARDAATYVTEDVGKVYRVGTTTPAQLYMLTDHTSKTFQKVAPIEEGTVVLPVGTRADLISGTGLCEVSSNNDMPALVYRDAGGVEEKARWSLPSIKQYLSGGIQVRIRHTVPATGVGGATKGVRWIAGYNFINVGDNLGAYTEVASSEQGANSTWIADELRSYVIGTIPHAAISTSDRFFLKVSRDRTHVDDDVAQDVYVHAIELVFTGLKLSDFQFQL